MPACTQASWNTPEMPVGPSYRDRVSPSRAAVSSSCADPVTWIGRVCGTSASSAPSPMTVATWWSTAILSSSSQNARQRKFGSMPCTRMTSLGESVSRQADSLVVGQSMVLVTPSISRTVGRVTWKS